MSGVSISCQVLAGGESFKVDMSTVSAQTPVLTHESYLVTFDANCFVRKGTNPTALSDGTDQLMLANNQYRIVPVTKGDKIAMIMSSGSGIAYFTPNA